MNLDSGGFVSLLLFGLLAAGANLLGGFVLIRSGAHRFGERFLKYLVALGAGFMLAAIFIEIIPESVGIWTETLDGRSSAEAVVGAMTLLLAGYLVIQLFEHTIAPHFHFGAETHPESMIRPSAAYAAVGGLWIHTFFDGVSIAAAFLVNFRRFFGFHRDFAAQDAGRVYCGVDNACVRTLSTNRARGDYSHRSCNSGWCRGGRIA